MAEVKRNDSLLKGLVLKNPPSATVREPRDDILKLRVGKNGVELHREILSSLLLNRIRALLRVITVGNNLSGSVFFLLHLRRGGLSILAGRRRHNGRGRGLVF